MKITIITVCFNSEKTIEQTIKSVFEQTYKDIEYLIIDGGSRDQTLSILNKYKRANLRILSEPDNGIYDAMNKGIYYANGKIIGYLNSDDFYHNPFVIEKIANAFNLKKVDCVFGDIVYVNKSNTDLIQRHWLNTDFYPGAFIKGWHPPHPAFFVKKSIYEKYGNYDLSFEISSDFELMLRLIEKYKISSYYLPELIVKMRAGGESGKNIRNIFIGNMNVLRAFKKNNIPVNRIMYLLIRLLPKIKDVIKRKFTDD